MDSKKELLRLGAGVFVSKETFSKLLSHHVTDAEYALMERAVRECWNRAMIVFATDVGNDILLKDLKMEVRSVK